MKTLASALVLVLFSATGAFAVQLRNEDSGRYDLRIDSGISTLSTFVNSNTTMKACDDTCSIEVMGVGTIEASGDETVVIQDGELSIED